MKIVANIFCIIGVAILLWILISWADVVANNSPYQDRQPHGWNAFVLLTEIRP